ncbi:hypothetical protein [Methylomonas sp. AM2-LC]|uniref:hypothetical protein n=1 Tax=Methylomonas sp. AM2-LC TaxID=3153301 RepID=UPI0032671604
MYSYQIIKYVFILIGIMVVAQNTAQANIASPLISSVSEVFAKPQQTITMDDSGLGLFASYTSEFDVAAWSESQIILSGNYATDDWLLTNADTLTTPQTTTPFAINQTSLDAVPAPDAVWLFLTGYMGLLGINRRKHSS